MEVNGWQFININFDMPENMSADDLSACGDTGWYGFTHPGTGKVSATFAGTGTATLDYGNCYTGGSTNTFLNDSLIDVAGNNTPSKQITFDFSPGDVLVIVEAGGIIKLNSLTIQCRGQ